MLQDEMVRELLSIGSPGRDQLFEYLHGRDYRELPIIAQHRFKSKFASNIETDIERCHAQLHGQIALAPHHSEAFQSVAARKKEPLEYMQQSETAALRLSKFFGKIGNAKGAVEVLGLQAHPAFAEYVSEDFTLSEYLPHKLAVRVIYRGDVATQFQHLPALVAGDGPPAPPVDRRESRDDVLPGLPPHNHAAGGSGGSGGIGGCGASTGSGGASGVVAPVHGVVVGGGGPSASSSGASGSVNGAPSGGGPLGGGDPPGDGGSGSGGGHAVSHKAPARNEDEIINAIFTSVQVKHFLATITSDSIYAMPAPAGLTTLEQRLRPQLAISTGLFAKLMDCKVDWAVLRKRALLPEVKMDEEDEGTAAPAERPAEVLRGSQPLDKPISWRGQVLEGRKQGMPKQGSRLRPRPLAPFMVYHAPPPCLQMKLICKFGRAAGNNMKGVGGWVRGRAVSGYTVLISPQVVFRVTLKNPAAIGGAGGKLGASDVVASFMRVHWADEASGPPYLNG